MDKIFAVLETIGYRLVSDEQSGQGLAEYALILALVAVVAVAALTGLGAAIVDKLGQVANAL